MKYLIYFFLQLSFISLQAQKNIAVYNQEFTSGKNLVNGRDIVSTEFVFPEKIYQSYIDTSNNSLTIELRGTSKNGKWLNNTGTVVSYDLLSRRHKWQRNLVAGEGFIQMAGMPFILRANKILRLNGENGSDIWFVRNTLGIINPDMGILAGYRITATNNTLEGLSLSDGKRIWRREIAREFGWNDVLHINDSVIMISASGLHSLNLKNGQGWDYNSPTGRNDYTSMVLTNVAGIALGVLTGTFFYTADHDVLTGIASNMLLDSTSIILATREKVANFNLDGSCNWLYYLPKEMTSSSSVFINDDRICMINRGYAFYNGKQVDYGTPFFASFDKHSGRQVFFVETGGKKEQVMDYEVKGDELLLVFKDRLAKYGLNDGMLIAKKQFTSDTSGTFISLAGSHVYYRSGSVYEPLINADTTHIILVTESNRIIMYNEELEADVYFDDNDIYVHYGQLENMKFLAHGDRTIVIDKTGKKIAELTASSQAKIIGTTLYDIRERSYIEIPLDDLVSSVHGMNDAVTE